jgi:hypothetical protein
MAFRTHVAPAAAGSGNLTAVAAICPDRGIWYRIWEVGNAAGPWRELCWPLPTDAAPAVSIVTETVITTRFTKVQLAITDRDHTIYTTTFSRADTGFEAWRLLPGLQTNVAPAVTTLTARASADGLTVPVTLLTAPDGRLLYTTPRLGAGIWRELNGGRQSDDTPAAAFVGERAGHLFVAIRGRDGQLYFNQANLDRPFVGWQPLGFSSRVAPAAAAAGTTSVVVATDPEGRIFYRWWREGKPEAPGVNWRGMDGATSLRLLRWSGILTTSCSS